jgi:hypothetical protein
MNKTTAALCMVLVAVAAVYVWQFTDWFKQARIGVMAQVRPSRSVQPGSPGEVKTYPVLFAFDREIKLTEIRVVVAKEVATNKYAHAVWQMISDSNSVPVKGLTYGQPVRGMKPKIPQARPEPLLPDVTYRCFVVSGKYKGQVDFRTSEVPGSGAEAP